MISYRQSVAALIFCRRLADSEATDIPSFMCMDYYVGSVITQLM